MKNLFIAFAVIVSVVLMALPLEAQSRGRTPGGRQPRPQNGQPSKPFGPNSGSRSQSSNLDFGEQLAVGVLSGLARGVGQGIASNNNRRPGGYGGRPGYYGGSGYYNGRSGGYGGSGYYNGRSGGYGGSGYYKGRSGGYGGSGYYKGRSGGYGGSGYYNRSRR